MTSKPALPGQGHASPAQPQAQAQAAPFPSAPFAAAAPPGTVLDGRYRLEGRIATGGMGEVWRGLDQTLGRPVAIKLLRPEYASDQSFLVRFRGEARHAARLSHPGVASVYDYGEVAAGDDQPTAFLVMELVEGEPLSTVLHREKRLSAERTLDILGQAADALQAAHALGVVHRDVKPGNLLIRPDGAVKVTDFGIARAVDAAPLTATGIMMGTAYYVSPEQASGRPVTPASDVYSLGVVAYECLTGRRPFDDRNPIVVVMAHQQDTPPPLPADIPYKVRALVDSAMAKDPARRPASAGVFARTAASIRRSVWNAEAGARWPGQSAADATAQYAAPTGAPDAFATMMDRSPAWGGRPPSWLSDSPTSSPAAPGAHGARGVQGQGAPEEHAGPGMPPPRPTGMPGVNPTAAEHRSRAAKRTHQRKAGDTSALPPGWAGTRSSRRHGHGHGQRRPIPLPLLVVLLVLTVVVSALLTRQLAGGGGSSDAGAPLPRGVADITVGAGGLVSDGHGGVRLAAVGTRDGVEGSPSALGILPGPPGPPDPAATQGQGPPAARGTTITPPSAEGHDPAAFGPAGNELGNTSGPWGGATDGERRD